MITRWTILCGCLVVVGCGDVGPAARTSARHPPGYVEPPSTDNLPLVDHPEYAHWKNFPVGASVVRQKEVTNQFGAVRVTTKLRLTEKTSDKVVVESQITVDRGGEGLIENPPSNTSFPAQFRLPAGMQVEQFSLPSLKAKLVGQETRSAAGREYQTQLFTWQERNETGPMTVRYWRSDAMPGRFVRQEVSGENHNSVEEVIEVAQPEPAGNESP
jgi:hypothetical protein